MRLTGFGRLCVFLSACWLFATAMLGPEPFFGLGVFPLFALWGIWWVWRGFTAGR